MDSEVREPGIQAIDVGAKLLLALSSARGPVQLRWLAERAGMTPSKAHRYLVSFVRSGLASQELSSRRYSLGPAAVEVGLAALASFEPLGYAARLQADLRDQFDETFVLSVWGSHGPATVAVDESSRPVMMTMKVGAWLPILSTATGMVFTAYLPRRLSEELVRQELASSSERHRLANSLAEVDRVCADVRRCGYAYNGGHLTPGVSAAAFPVMGPAKEPIAVIAVVGQDGRINPRRDATLVTGIQREMAGRRVGGPPPAY